MTRIMNESDETFSLAIKAESEDRDEESEKGELTMQLKLVNL